MLNGLTITYVVVTSKIPGNANNEPPNVEHEGGGGEERGFSLTKQSHLSRACVRIAFSSNVMEEEEKGKKKKKGKNSCNNTPCNDRMHCQGGFTAPVPHE